MKASEEHQGDQGKADGKLAQSLKVLISQSICFSLRFDLFPCFSLFVSVYVSVFLQFDFSLSPISEARAMLRIVGDGG